MSGQTSRLAFRGCVCCVTPALVSQRRELTSCRVRASVGRQRAHDLVYDICRVSATEDKPLVDLLANNAEISRHVSRAELEKMCDPANYLGLAGEMVDRVLAREKAR